jgi:PhnB protein
MPDHAWTLSRIEDALASLPRPEFRARLRAELERTAAMTMTTDTGPAEAGRHVSVRQTAAPLLRVRNAAEAITFYTRAFGAREMMRFDAGGRVPHAEIAIGNAVILLGDEAPEHGYPGPDQLGGSPVAIRLDVDDPYVAVDRAVAAGARIVLPVADHFYGERTGTVVDPFGYRWSLTKVIEPMSVEEMHRRMGAMPPPAPAVTSVTPYVVVQNAPALIDFAKAAFGAEETITRAIGSAGGLHGEVRIGDSTVMIGGGAPELAWRGASKLAALHVYVPDVDAAFARARDAGATVDHAPADMEYGERGAGVIDPEGNRWYIATAQGEHYIPRGLHSVNVYLHPLRAEPVIRFLARALDAVEVEKHAAPDGIIHHARVQVGSSTIEMGEAHGPYQPIPTMFFVSVADSEVAYRRALEAGATSVVAPVDRSFGRLAGVRDPFGNEWHFAAPIRADKL